MSHSRGEAGPETWALQCDTIALLSRVGGGPFKINHTNQKSVSTGYFLLYKKLFSIVKAMYAYCINIGIIKKNTEGGLERIRLS